MKLIETIKYLRKNGYKSLAFRSREKLYICGLDVFLQHAKNKEYEGLNSDKWIYLKNSGYIINSQNPILKIIMLKKEKVFH